MPLPARAALRRVLPYYRPYRLQVAAGLAMVVVAAGLATVIPALLRDAIDILRAGGEPRPLRRIAGVMLVTAAGGGTLRFGMRHWMNGISRRIETDLRRDLFAHLLTLDAAWHQRHRVGDLMARLTNDVTAVRMAAGPAVMYLVNTIAGGAFALAMMARISPRLTLVALLPLAGLPVLMLRLGRLVHHRFEAVQARFADLATRAQENLAGVRVVRAYRQEAAELARFDAAGDAYLDASVRLARVNGVMNPGFALLAGLGSLLTIAVGGRLLLEDRLTVGGFVAFGIYLAMLTWPMIALGWTANLFQRAAASMGRVLEVLDAAPEQVRGGGTRTLPPATGGRALEFRHVWFRYPDRAGDPAPAGAGHGRDAARGREPPGGVADARWALRDVSFRVEAGGTLAVVGATGAGKSALMDLVPRLFDPQRGEILLDGVPIRDLPLDVLRREIGYVPQETLLFSETIGDNVAYGLDALDPDGAAARADGDRVADLPLETPPEVVLAAATAQLADTVARLPAGFDTRLGERGINLSGGQKQRAALARALARDPQVVLLDDALSAVDTDTEAAILAGLRDALHARTALVASHRISTVREADWIIVLDEGAIVEQGRHDDLVAAGGRYAQLLDRQRLLEDIEAGTTAGA
jgi:ATP-binding cassette subfamily B protein